MAIQNKSDNKSNLLEVSHFLGKIPIIHMQHNNHFLTFNILYIKTSKMINNLYQIYPFTQQMYLYSINYATNCNKILKQK